MVFKKKEERHSHIHKTLTHSVWLFSQTFSINMGEYGEHECATLMTFKKKKEKLDGANLLVDPGFWHMQHMKCEWKAPPKRKSRENRRIKCSAQRAVHRESLAKVLARESERHAWNASRPSPRRHLGKPSAEQLTTMLLTPLPGCRGDRTPNCLGYAKCQHAERGSTLHILLLARFFLLCFAEGPPFLKYKASRVHCGMSACQNTRQKKKKLEYCKEVAQLTNRHCNKHTLQTLKEAFFSPGFSPLFSQN